MTAFLKHGSRLWLLIPVIMLAAIAGIFGVYTYADRTTDDARITLRARQSLSKGSYYGYVQPWGADGTAIGRWWGRNADSLRVSLDTFPNNTTIVWRWPPFKPVNTGGGVWGYDHIGYGDYDGGTPERPVQPRRVDDIRRMQQQFAWTGDFSLGEATLLTEFYLRKDPKDTESRLLEIGWFLHVPAATASFVAKGKPIGIHVDPNGRRWTVARTDDFVTFLPEDGQDVRTGAIDMLAGLTWLKGKGEVSGGEWVTGVAIGSEPFFGVGRVNLSRWSVQFD